LYKLAVSHVKYALPALIAQTYLLGGISVRLKRWNFHYVIHLSSFV